jgi:hypothetical protein
MHYVIEEAAEAEDRLESLRNSRHQGPLPVYWNWNLVPDVSRYQVIVTQEDFGVEMTVDLLAPINGLQVPPTFLKPGIEYQIEVLAILPNGNRAITESSFTTKSL